MNIDEFKQYYSTTIMHYQRIEHDIKHIYASC